MSRLSLAIVLLALSHPAFACGSLPVHEHQAAVERDLRHQAELVAGLSSEANAILVARVTATFDTGVRVQVVEYLKGSGATELEVQPSKYLHTIGCFASASFRNIDLQSGKQYILYLSGNRVLRAGKFIRPRRLFRFPKSWNWCVSRCAPNNSFKPTPLRGTA